MSITAPARTSVGAACIERCAHARNMVAFRDPLPENMKSTSAPSTRPSLRLNRYRDAALADPVGTYRTIRDAGPAVWERRERARQ